MSKVNLKKVLLAVILTAYFTFTVFSTGNWHVIDGLNLSIHEAGHLLFFFFGKFMHILGGTLTQLLLPLLFSLYFFSKKNAYAGFIVLLWLGQNFVNVSIYASDAVLMKLPLLGGSAVIHDWNYLLGALGILDRAEAVGLAFYSLGLIIIAVAFVGSILQSKKVITVNYFE